MPHYYDTEVPSCLFSLQYIKLYYTKCRDENLLKIDYLSVLHNNFISVKIDYSEKQLNLWQSFSGFFHTNSSPSASHDEAVDYVGFL